MEIKQKNKKFFHSRKDDPQNCWLETTRSAETFRRGKKKSCTKKMKNKIEKFLKRKNKKEKIKMKLLIQRFLKRKERNGGALTSWRVRHKGYLWKIRNINNSNAFKIIKSTGRYTISKHIRTEEGNPLCTDNGKHPSDVIYRNHTRGKNCIVKRWVHSLYGLHSVNDQAAEEVWSNLGYIKERVWFNNDEEHRDDDLPSKECVNFNGDWSLKCWKQHGEYCRLIGGPTKVIHDCGVITSRWFDTQGELYVRTNGAGTVLPCGIRTHIQMPDIYSEMFLVQDTNGRLFQKTIEYRGSPRYVISIYYATMDGKGNNFDEEAAETHFNRNGTFSNVYYMQNDVWHRENNEPAMMLYDREGRLRESRFLEHGNRTRPPIYYDIDGVETTVTYDRETAEPLAPVVLTSYVDKEAYCIVCVNSETELTNFVRTPCEHVGHEVCLRQWIDIRRTCPHCRFAFP